MCLLSEIWSIITYLCCSECCKIEPSKKTKKKKKKQKTKSIPKGDKTRTGRQEPIIGQQLTVSKISDDDLFDKYRVVLKDQQPNQYLQNNGYEVTDQKIGRGGFGSVFIAYKLGLNGTKEKICVKVLDSTIKTKKIMDSIKNEFFITEAVMNQIKKTPHNHIITFYDRFLLEFKDSDNYPKVTAYLFMELADQKCIEDEIEEFGPMSNLKARRYFAQIVLGVEHLAAHHIVHRDLKLTNFLLVKSKTDPDFNDVKITDFGLSKVNYTELTGYIMSDRRGGTLQYKAPEIIELQLNLSNQKFDPYKADIWALGVCLHRMLTASYPFDFNFRKTTNFRAHLKNVLDNQKNKQIIYPNDPNIHIKRLAKDLIERQLEPKAELRPPIYNVKAHQWLAEEITPTLSVTANVPDPPENIDDRSSGV